MTEVEFDRLLEALRMAIEPAPQEGRQPAPQLQNSVRSRRWPVERVRGVSRNRADPAGTLVPRVGMQGANAILRMGQT
jgi:hypothetical protein